MPGCWASLPLSKSKALLIVLFFSHNIIANSFLLFIIIRRFSNIHNSAEMKKRELRFTWRHWSDFTRTFYGFLRNKNRDNYRHTYIACSLAECAKIYAFRNIRIRHTIDMSNDWRWCSMSACVRLIASNLFWKSRIEWNRMANVEISIPILLANSKYVCFFH